MTWLLASLVAALVVANVTLGIWLHGSNKEKDNARDAADKWKDLHASTDGELRLTQASNTALVAELNETKKLLTAAQEQRNLAFKEASDHLVQRIRSAGTEEAAKMVADILARDLRTTPILGVPKAKLPHDPKDTLIDPFEP